MSLEAERMRAHQTHRVESGGHNTVRGFTLIETIVTVSMTALLLGLAAPNMSAFMKNNRLATSGNEILRSFQLARTESIKRQRNVVVCASSNSSTCSYGDFVGWIVFEDTDGNWQRDSATEALIEQHESLDSTLKISTDNDGILTYGPSGFAMPPGPSGKTPSRMIGLCDSRGNVAANTSGTESVARAVMIDTTGRARVSKKKSDVTAAGDCA